MSAIEANQDRSLNEDIADPNAAEFVVLKKDLTAAIRARGDWAKEARECFDFVAGYQWAEEDERILREQNRPPVKFNRTAPLIEAVCGLEVNNRQAVVYLPRQIGQTGFNEMISGAAKWIRDECNAEDEESEAFRDLTIAGEGWTEMRMDFDADPMGKVVEERIDCLEMGVNKGAARANYEDARMIYRVREMEPDDLRALLDLPEDLQDAVLDATRWLPDTFGIPADGGQGNKKDYPEQTRPGIKRGKLTTVKVVQCQYWKREPVHMVATANDQEVKPMSPEDFATFQQRADAAGIEYQAAQTVKKTYYECFIGAQILDRKPMKMEMFQFKCMTGKRDRKKKCFYGMVRDMMDPQRWSNKFLSQTMHHINVNAKGGLLAETDAFTNPKKAQTDWSDPTKIVWVKPGSLTKQKVKERQPVPLPPGLDQLMMFAISSIRDVTGVNLELLGQADREQAASLEQQRRQSAMTILATMFDSLRKYRKLNGRLMLHFIWLLPEGTLIRISDKGQYQYIPLVKQGLELEKFDVIIDQAPTSPDQKQYVWGITQQILQMNVLPPPAVVELLKYSPYPESVVQEIRKALGMDGEMPPEQLQQKLQQAEQALQIMEQKWHEAEDNAKTAEDKKEVELLKINVDEYRAETERLAAQWQSKLDTATAIMDAADTATAAGMGAPDAGGGEGAAVPAQDQDALSAKIDALTQLVTQLVQGGQAGAPPPQPSIDGGVGEQ